MRIRDSGMPDESFWESLFDVPLIMSRLGVERFADVAELGCGPGHVAKYLHDQGVRVVGIDFSSEMIQCAARFSPGIDFKVGDMKALDIPTASLAGVVAFYSIVHFRGDELLPVTTEMRRVLAPGGLALVSFHVGDQVVHVEDLFGAPVNLDFVFHSPHTVVETLRASRFAVIEHIERQIWSERCHRDDWTEPSAEVAVATRRDANTVVRPVPVEDNDELASIRKRQGSDGDCVQDREERRRRAASQRDDRDRDGARHWIAQAATKRAGHRGTKLTTPDAKTGPAQRPMTSDRRAAIALKSARKWGKTRATGAGGPQKSAHQPITRTT